MAASLVSRQDLTCPTGTARQRLAEPRWLHRNAEALEPLVQHTVRAAMQGQFEGRGLANVAHGTAGVWKSVRVGISVGVWKSLAELFASISKEAKRRLEQFNAQELTNMTWAFARVGQQFQQLFQAVAKMAERRLDQFNA